MDEATYYEIIHGGRRGLAADIARGLLTLAALPYTGAVVARNLYYDHSPTALRRVAVPVISVGNLTLGGTGKTPFVAWLVKRLQARGLRVAIVSRGYKAAGQDVNDEACELARHVTGVPHLQNASRWQGASLAMAQHAAQVIVLDDGFQHRRLHRDLDIVLLDALRPFGVPPEKLFPRGTLREPLSALRRAHAVVLTRVNQVSADQPRAIRLAAGKFAPHAAWATARHQPVELRGVDGMCQPLDILAGRRVFAFCGIGHAAAFLRTLEGCGCQVIGSREFGDHHRFSAGDMRLIAQDVERSSEAEFVLCTTKDLVKIDSPIIAGRSVYALAVEMRIEHGLPELEQQVDRIVLAAERQLPRVT